ncbi:protein containing prepilin-type N- cleavage/methylation domain protein [Sulfurimonas sp. SAG-AH-194-C20]|nr:protein containing prepilin-type N- cleavage/methylation domain protein [Sulfurimonas sp. SAG-AH-194-C20]
MIELIFVIVIMGIIGKFGVEFLAQAYKTFIFSSINNTLQSNSAYSVEFITSRLQYRIKDSVIARTAIGGVVVPLADAVGNTYTVLEWISTDMDGFRATSLPNWSGVIDLDSSSSTTLVSPETNTTAVGNLIAILSDSGSSIADIGLYFIGSNSDVLNSFGWSGALTDQSGSIHPVTNTLTPNEFNSSNASDFTGVDVYEYYKLVWTANAIVIDSDSNLIFYYDYQPWNGQTIANAKSSIIMQNISTFQFRALGSIMKIQVCAQSDIIQGNSGEGGYSLCKEKTIF